MLLSQVVPEVPSASVVLEDEFQSPHVRLCAIVVVSIADIVFEGDVVVTQCLVNCLPGCGLLVGGVSLVVCQTFGYVCNRHPCLTLVLSPKDVFDLCSDLFDAFLSDDVCGFLLVCWTRYHIPVNACRAPRCEIASIGIEEPRFLKVIVQCLDLLGPVCC